MATTPEKGKDSTVSNPTVSMRFLMQGKEVKVLIGHKGEVVKRFRDVSGAKITISDSLCPERVLTITGNNEVIFSAIKLLVEKFEESSGHGSSPNISITLKLLVPVSQCGSLIGKGGSKIKEIRGSTGANIQVASDALPNSTDRTVTVSGTANAVTQCIYHVYRVMVESPPKGGTIPYRPKPTTAGGPVLFSGGKAYVIKGNYAVPSAPDVAKVSNSPFSGLLGLGSVAAGANPATTPVDIAALAALAGSQLRSPMNMGSGSQTHEMTVPNELIGCIIGKGGTKIAEIRQITGAMITISKYDDASDDASKQDRTITIKGNSEQVALAQYLINTSMQLHKAHLEAGKGSALSGVNHFSIPLAQLLKSPQALNALTSLTGIQGLAGYGTLGGPDSLQKLVGGAAPAQRQKAFQAKMRTPTTTAAGNDGSPKDTKRSKFAPY